MHFTLTCFASLLVVNVVDAAMDRSIPALVPRNHITHEYIDACQVVNCTVTPHERAQCLLDCPPLAGPTGAFISCADFPTAHPTSILFCLSFPCITS